MIQYLYNWSPDRSYLPVRAQEVWRHGERINRRISTGTLGSFIFLKREQSLDIRIETEHIGIVIRLDRNGKPSHYISGNVTNLQSGQQGVFELPIQQSKVLGYLRPY